MCSKQNIDQRLANFPGSLTREEAISRYAVTFGRAPNVVLSPIENGTNKWYLGFLSEAEAVEFNVSLLEDALLARQGRLA